MNAIQAFHFDTAIGTMAIAWCGQKIVAIQLPESNLPSLLKKLRVKRHSTEIQWNTDAPPFALALAKRISKHLAGKPQAFSLEHFSLEKISPFHRKVYERAVGIPSGKLRTYGELAKEAGSPKAFRAVGQAMAKNPFPIVVPCHRVVGSGWLGGFTAHGGLTTKNKILEIEAHL